MQIARNPNKFTFLSQCLPSAAIAVGDARLSLATEPAASRDLLAIDAFSSNAIPMHLITREAVRIYSRVIAPDGLLMFHISNRYIDLEPVLAAIAADGGWRIMVREYQPDANAVKHRAAASFWVAMSRSPATMNTLIASSPGGDWRKIAARSGTPVWTDDYGSILPLLKH